MLKTGGLTDTRRSQSQQICSISELSIADVELFGEHLADTALSLQQCELGLAIFECADLFLSDHGLVAAEPTNHTPHSVVSEVVVADLASTAEHRAIQR